MNQQQMKQQMERIGFACAYSPLPLIAAAGFVPYRILPLTNAADQAGSILHDNLCPHVKRILDRGMDRDLPSLSGMVFMNSCDAMRRLCDAWQAIRPSDRTVLVDLPVAAGEAAVAYFADELSRLRGILSEWSGSPIGDPQIEEQMQNYQRVALGLGRLSRQAARGGLADGWRTMQALFNRSVTQPVTDLLNDLEGLEAAADTVRPDPKRVRLLLFGNVLPDPEAFELIERSGAQVVADDLCTGSRQIAAIMNCSDLDVSTRLARAILARPACARTLSSTQPLRLGQEVLARATEVSAQGVVAHVLKFCDPYLARLPEVRQTLRDANLPLLVLEGDCTMRSLGQHRTRIEAFVEMLGGSRP